MSDTPRAVAFALAALLLVAPLALASQSFELGEALAPSFGAADEVLLRAVDGAPAELVPLVEGGRLALLALRGVADATVLGASDGDAGAELGTPDAVGVEASGVAVERVAAPAVPIEVAGQSYEVATPGTSRTFWVPGADVPSLHAEVPAHDLDVGVPAVEVPPVQAETPALTVATPGIAVPDVRFETPPVAAGPQHHEVDLDALDLNVDELRGTLYVGPYQIPYALGPLDVGEDRLPEAVPRVFAADVPGGEALAAQEFIVVRGFALVAPQQHAVPGKSVAIPAVGPGLPAVPVGDAAVPGLDLDTPAYSLAPQQRTFAVQPQRIATPILPGASTETPEVVLLEQGAAVPGAAWAQELPRDADGFGYVGYGRGADSSLYPYACTAAIGCWRLADEVGPWVEAGDAALDAAAAALDGAVIARPG